MAELDDILQILTANANTPFVKRILHRDEYPTLDLGDGQVATHKMAWGEVDTPDGKRYLVYPTVVFKDGKLTDMGDAAWEDALQRGNFIEFDNPRRADWFSKRYKAIWDDMESQPEPQ